MPLTLSIYPNLGPSRWPLVVKNQLANAQDVRDTGLISALGRSPGEGQGNPLQCSCLENPTDRGNWWIQILLTHKTKFLQCIIYWYQSTFFSSFFEIILQLWQVKVTQLCPTLCDPMDYTVRGILQARILEWVAFPFSRGSSQPRDQTQVSRIAGRFFTSWATGKSKNTGVGSVSLLQWIIPTQELDWGFLHCRRILYQLSDLGSGAISNYGKYYTILNLIACSPVIRKI